MFKDILLFELWIRKRKVSTYLYFLLFVGLGLLAVSRASVGHGFLCKLTNAGIGNINANSPFAIHYLIILLSNYGLIFIALIFGNAAYRDFKENTSGLYFSYPITKFNYFAARFSGAFITILFILSGIGIGAFLGSVMPFTNSEKIGSVNLLVYFYPYLTSIIPNLIFIGALFFSLVILTKKFIPIYLGMIIILLLYLIGVSVYHSQQSYYFASLIDPFGLISIQSIYSYWMAAQKNVMLIPLNGSFLINRLIWSLTGSFILIFSILKFKLSLITQQDNKNQEKPETSLNAKVFQDFSFENYILSKIKKSFNLKNHLKQVGYLAVTELKVLLKNSYFLTILILGIIFIFILGFRNVGIIKGTQTYPLTSQVLATTQTSLYLFNLIIIFFTSGELIWKERNKKVNEFIDVLPVPEWVFFAGKLGTMVLLQFILMTIIFVSGVLIQTIHGFYDFEFLLYFNELFGIRLPYYTLISIFALFIQVIVNRKFLGYVITLLLVDDFLPGIGLDHHLWRFGSVPTYIYSDLNGYGPYAKALFFFNVYWMFLAVILVVFSILFFIRGNESSLKERIHKYKSRNTKGYSRIGITGFVGCLFLGIFIIYNTNYLNNFDSDKKKENKMVSYEKIYKKYENHPQPIITDVKINVDIFPAKRKGISSGRLVLENKTNKKIDELFVQFPDFVKIDSLNLNRCYSIKEEDAKHSVKILLLNNPIFPGEKIDLNFKIGIENKGFKNHDYRTNLVKNGTFLYYYQLIPAIGYDPSYSRELEDNEKRAKFNLPYKASMSSVKDTNATMNNIICKDAEWINYEAIISTSENQTALTSGELIKEWKEKDRNYFHYKTDRRILKYFPIISAEYKVAKDKWNDVSIEVYYHKKHHYNIDLMLEAVKQSLEYYSNIYSPYQFKQVKIVEFPKYELYAEAFPDIITHSEGYGFTAKFDDTKVDYVYRVTAHEIGHQWWAHQVVPANVEGAFFLGETMTQYSALMLIKKKYSKEKLNKYMKNRIDTYLRGRAKETNKEVPLINSNIDLWYMNYEKGIVVMNALQDYIGKENLNNQLQEYVKKVAFQEAPYTTSVELIKNFRKATPDSLQYLITDMFETITLYDNKVVNASVKKLTNNKYLVSATFEINKYRSDEIGNENSEEINDYLAFGVFDENGEVLYQKKHWINNKMNEMQIEVDEIPAKVVIDPSFLLIDKNATDNIFYIP